jgi:hypothetical protein
MQSNVLASTGTSDLGEIASSSVEEIIIALSEGRVRLCVDHFDFVTRMLGHTTWQAKAEFIGMDPATLSRARSGAVVGEKLVARTLVALDRHRGWFAEKNTAITFDSLFEIASPAGCAA